MSKHFMSEDLVALSLFDDVVPSETKQRVVANLLGEDDEEKHLERPGYQASFLQEKHLEDSVTLQAIDRILTCSTKIQVPS